VLDALAARGIRAASQTPEIALGSLQYHACEIGVERARLGEVIALMLGLGYVLPVEPSAGQIKALAQTAEALTMVRVDEYTTRITLTFFEPPPLRLPRALRPSFAEFAMVDLPPVLSLGYVAFKPLRVFVERVTKRRPPVADVDFLGTPEGMLPKLFERLGLDVEDRLVDLGCGDGRVVIAAAEQTGCFARGVEMRTELVALAQSCARESKANARIKIEAGDILTCDLSAESVVFLFLPHHLLAQVLPTLKARLKPDARVLWHEQTKLVGMQGLVTPLPVFSEHGITVAYVAHANAL